MNEIVDLLQKSHLGCGVGDELLLEVASLGVVETLSSGEPLCRIKDQDCDLFIVKEGRLKMTTADDDKLREIGPGGVAGEVSFVDAGPRHSQFVAIGRTTVVRFPAKPLRALLAGNRQDGFMFMANLSRLMALRLRHADDRLDALMDLEADDVWEHAL